MQPFLPSTPVPNRPKDNLFYVFEGGGARGIAHVGALKVFDESMGLRGGDYEIAGVAGTSIGAVIAALVAAGYTSDEIYNPTSGGILASDRFKFDYFFPKEATRLAKLRKDARAAFEKPSWLQAGKFLKEYWDWVQLIRIQGGILRTDKFERWLDEHLQAKLRQAKPASFTGRNGTVAFRDLPTPLKIIAADTIGRKPRLYARPHDDGHSVSAAVAASISIPLLFSPKNDCLDEPGPSVSRAVDGGIVSNFPAWVFEEERKGFPLLSPIVGFRLTEHSESSDPSILGTRCRPQHRPFTFFQYCSDLFHTAVFGNSCLETRNLPGFYSVPLAVDISALDFDATEEQKRRTYENGVIGASNALRRGLVGLRGTTSIRKNLIAIDSLLRHLVGANPSTHLRLNVSLPLDGERLKISHTLNMDSDKDSDDRLEFRKGRGLCGKCWSELTERALCLTTAARANHIWQLDKYQLRLVREDLQALLCIPIFDTAKLKGMLSDGGEKESLTIERVRSAKEACFVGVLSVDSNEDLYNQFATLLEEVNTEGNVKVPLFSLISEHLSQALIVR